MSMAPGRLRSAVLVGAVVMVSAWLLCCPDRNLSDRLRERYFGELRMMRQMFLQALREPLRRDEMP